LRSIVQDFEQVFILELSSLKPYFSKIATLALSSIIDHSGPNLDSGFSSCKIVQSGNPRFATLPDDVGFARSSAKRAQSSLACWPRLVAAHTVNKKSRQSLHRRQKGRSAHNSALIVVVVTGDMHTSQSPAVRRGRASGDGHRLVTWRLSKRKKKKEEEIINCVMMHT
jgi:hypothetical protein